MTEIRAPSPFPSPPRGEGWGEGHFGYLDIGLLGFVWDLEFGDWNLFSGVDSTSFFL